ncbi:hypothetical protein [Sphingomonas sp. Leaf4]|uniref:hypothetical protein n=1 Tax=Sphingomonas sp. Leaf4 TaxID=2876553 RepID=UPI001E65B9FC|nr:hypothetical protein [Sphingomonas sp. Leaf4]
MTGTRKRIGRIAAELVVGFGALILLDRLLGTGGAFAKVQPNPLWLPVLVMALAYGTMPALAAAAIASALWLLHAAPGAAERDYLDHLFHLSLPPLLWFVAAVAVGEVTMLRTARYHLLERRASVARRNVARLTEAFHRLARTNRTLQVEVATDPRTLGHVVATASRLGSGDPAERRAALAALIAMAARSEDFTCYRFAGTEARAWLRGASAMTRPEVLPDALATLARRRQGPIHVGRRADRPALAGIGIVAIPLAQVESGRIAGCLVIHVLPFAALNAHALAEMAEIGGWLTPLITVRERGTATMIQPSGRVA